MRYFNKVFLFSSILLLSLVDRSVLAENLIKVEDFQHPVIIGKDISYLEDLGDTLTLDDILQSENQRLFVSHNKEVFSRPGTKSAIWFKITVQNETREDLWLEVGSNYAWYIDFYTPDSLGQYNDPILTGTMRPDSNKLYDVNFFWLPVNQASGSESITYYLKVKSGLTFELPLQIGTIRALSKIKDHNDFLTAGFLGIILVMLLYNLFIYLSTRDHIYLYYLGYLFVMGFSMPYANGYPFIENINFLFVDKQFWNTYFLVWHTPVYLLAGAFCIHYLDLKNNGPKFRRIIQLEIIVLSVIFPMLNIIGFQFVELVNAVQVTILIFYLTCLVTGYYFVFKGVKQAYFYAIGWTFLVLSAFVFFAVINGFLPFNPFTRNALYFGVALEVSLFSLALANRLNELRKEKDLIKSENLRLIQDQNTTLELKVKKRTAQLEEINEQLSQSNEELLLTTEKLDAQSTELREVNQTKDRLFAIISHDLRSPINSLKGLLDLMYGENISQEEFLKFSIDAKHNVEHVHFMLHNLLNWARIQLQGMTTNPKVVVLNQMVLQNIKLLKDVSQKKHIEVLSEIPNDIRIFADRDQIDLVVRNLLSNALKFTESGGKVIFKAGIQDDYCEFSISDNGIGISDSNIKDLFSVKSDNVTEGTAGEKGTGLGLPLCKDFVEKNNGYLSAESKKGEGTTFFVKLPLSKS